MNTKTKNLILSILVVIVASSVPAIIFGKYLEALTFLIAHTLIRPQFERQYHHIVPAICREITGVVFFFGIVMSLPISISLVSAIPINYLVGWIGDVTATRDFYEVQCNTMKARIEKLLEKLKDPRQELLIKCRDAKLSARDTEIALMYYCDRKTPKDIWLWLCESREYEDIEWDSVYRLLWTIGKKLNKK